MKAMIWLLVIAACGGLAYWFWLMRARWQERQRAAEDRFTSFIAQALPSNAPAAPLAAPQPAAPQPNNEVILQRLLLEAASKAGEAGEPALSIQLYARLLSRYPQTSFAGQARTAVEAQKKKLAAAKPAA